MGIADEKKFILGNASKDAIFSSSNTLKDEHEANGAYKEAVRKLFDVDRWSDLPGIASRFELHHADGERKNDSTPSIGDHIKIVLPGIPLDNWVVVTDRKEDERMAEFTVSPSRDPNAEGEQAEQVKHFFSGGATSTFRVKWEGNTIQAFEIGRNEAINNKGAEAGGRKIVNTMIAEGGWAGFQKLQWEKLTNYLVHKVEIEE